MPTGSSHLNSSVYAMIRSEKWSLSSIYSLQIRDKLRRTEEEKINYQDKYNHVKIAYREEKKEREKEKVRNK